MLHNLLFHAPEKSKRRNSTINYQMEHFRSHLRCKTIENMFYNIILDVYLCVFCYFWANLTT